MHFDLVIVGSGSGNSILTPDFDDWKVAIVEKGVFGGTCLNRGCIPSKMLVVAADRVVEANEAAELGVDVSVDDVRWPDIVARVFGRIDPIAAGGEQYRDELGNVTVFKDEARFVAPRELQVGDERVSADHIVVAAGARPFIPPITGLADTPFHTSDTIMRLPDVPGRLAIIGGGFIAAELAHVFDAMGSEVTIVHRRDVLLRDQDTDVSRRFTEIAGDRFELVLEARVDRVARSGGELVVDISRHGMPTQVRADELLVATGRVPNSDTIDARAAGLDVDESGYLVVDEQLRTNVDGVWALGDICNPLQLKHTANAEARIVAHNLVHPDDPWTVDHWPAPHAIFGAPQVAAAGHREQDLIAAGRPYVKAVRDYASTAYGWALEDSTSFCKLLADPDSRTLLGAHIMGPQASTLIQQLVQGMKFGRTVDEMATGMLYIHPALPEVVEQALLDL